MPRGKQIMTCYYEQIFEGMQKRNRQALPEWINKIVLKEVTRYRGMNRSLTVLEEGILTRKDWSIHQGMVKGRFYLGEWQEVCHDWRIQDLLGGRQSGEAGKTVWAQSSKMGHFVCKHEVRRRGRGRQQVRDCWEEMLGRVILENRNGSWLDTVNRK